MTIVKISVCNSNAQWDKHHAYIEYRRTFFLESKSRKAFDLAVSHWKSILYKQSEMKIRMHTYRYSIRMPNNEVMAK